MSMGAMYAVKENRCYTITEADAKQFQKAGYDILDEKNKVVAYGAGKMIAYEKYAEVLAENEKLKAEVAKLKEKKAK